MEPGNGRTRARRTKSGLLSFVIFLEQLLDLLLHNLDSPARKPLSKSSFADMPERRSEPVWPDIVVDFERGGCDECFVLDLLIDH